MASGDPDLQDTILPETLMSRDLSCGMQWVFGTPPMVEDGEVVRSSRRYVRW